MASIFTKIINGDIPAHKILEDDNFIAFLDAFPVQKGHTLIVPKQEIDNIFDVSDDRLSEMVVFAKKVAKSIEKSFSCRKVGVTVIGLEVPHAHIHLIPINEEKDMNFSNPKLKLEAEEMKEIANTIISNL
ncbi:MAG: HIT family protein [Marinifilaceae bacterium]|jgi:histidine triad (HIT) family protein|nr:HIT family protein [Marinilabiliaceae bacterium JC040]MCT4601256.1 HIT family protein [Marinifilaceae bacterium]